MSGSEEAAIAAATGGSSTVLPDDVVTSEELAQATAPFIEEAPSDGNDYVRRNQGWSLAAASTLPVQVSEPEKVAGTETTLRSFSPEDIADMAGIHGGGTGGVLDGGTPTTVFTGSPVIDLGDVT